jgi:DNA-directed RNA polymerase subunit RPC12/RpoP
MAIKIRCSECSKKISIDEAFAGGACRCPYCKAIVMVPGESRGGAAPDRPSAPRPDAPGDVPAQAAAAAAVVPEDVPMADPVAIQSYAAVVVIALLSVAMIVGVVVVVMHLRGGEKKPVQTPEELLGVGAPVVNPLKPTIEGPSVAGDVKILAPVVYVIDCGDSMEQMIDFSAKIVSVSVDSLKTDEKFSVIMALSKGDAAHETAETVKLPSGTVMFQNAMVNGGEASEKEALKFMTGLEETRPTGKVDVTPAIKAALDLNPKTVVVFTNKTIEGADALTEAAHKAGIQLVMMAMQADDDVKDSFKKLADSTEGQSRAYTMGALQAWVDQAKQEGQ